MQDFRNAKKKMVRKIYVFEAQKDVSKFKSIFKYYILEIKKWKTLITDNKAVITAAT